MAILIDETKRVLVQGITGREGRARTKLMREYGTNVVAGVTPGKAGQTVLGVPVFNTPQEAVKALGGIDISVLFVPAAGVKEAAISAIDAGIKLTVLVPDRVPVWDAMEIAAVAKANGAMFLGPNTLGVLSPGKGVVGMIGGGQEVRVPPGFQSSVLPGGVGVFEGLMILLLSPYLPSEALLPPLLVYRAVYYLLPLAVALVILVADELSQRRAQAARVGAAFDWVALDQALNSDAAADFCASTSSFLRAPVTFGASTTAVK